MPYSTIVLMMQQYSYCIDCSRSMVLYNYTYRLQLYLSYCTGGTKLSTSTLELFSKFLQSSMYVRTYEVMRERMVL
jgi:hypothetical protein